MYRRCVVAESRDCSLGAALLIVVASLVEHRLQGTWASVVVAHRLNCTMSCGIFPDQGLNLCPLPWQVDS